MLKVQIQLYTWQRTAQPDSTHRHRALFSRLLIHTYNALCGGTNSEYHVGFVCTDFVTFGYRTFITPRLGRYCRREMLCRFGFGEPKCAPQFSTSKYSRIGHYSLVGLQQPVNILFDHIEIVWIFIMPLYLQKILVKFLQFFVLNLLRVCIIVYKYWWVLLIIYFIFKFTFELIYQNWKRIMLLISKRMDKQQ